MHFLSFLSDLWQNNLTLLLLILILIIVIPFLLFYLTKAKEHPKGLVAAALSNMGERFGYYIMNAVLLLFLVSKFGLSDGTAFILVSTFCRSWVVSSPTGPRITTAPSKSVCSLWRPVTWPCRSRSSARRPKD